jgi:pyruvate dehydrogenase E1 component
VLGTDGFGRSESRRALRAFFEVDAAQVAYSAISALARRGAIPLETALEARRELGIDPEKPDPVDVDGECSFQPSGEPGANGCRREAVEAVS